MRKEIEPIIKQLDKSGEEFKNVLLKMIKNYKNVSRSDLAIFVAQVDFWKGFQFDTEIKSILTSLFELYDDQIKEILRYADKVKIRNAISIHSNVFDAFKYFQGKELLGRAESFSDRLKNSMLSSILSGHSFDMIKDELKKVPLTSTQMNTVISTGYNDYNRSIINLSYQDDKEERFLYFGTITPTSSKQCTWLLMNQDLGGYTRDKIEAGIMTPYGIINWNGRIPNFNCDDLWYPKTKILLQSILKLRESSQAISAMVLSK